MRKLVITLVVLAALLVGADFGARAIAESKAGEALARQIGTSTAPDVAITGFPFLFQAFGGRYRHITVSLAGADFGPLPLTGVVDLYGVGLPLSDAMSGKTDNMTADKADLTARTPVESLAAAINATGLTISGGAAGAVRLSRKVTVAGLPVTVSADATVTVTAGTLHLRAGKPTVAGVDVSALSPQITAQAMKALSFDVPLTGLPIKIDSASLGVDGTDLVIIASGSNIRVADL